MYPLALLVAPTAVKPLPLTTTTACINTSNINVLICLMSYTRNFHPIFRLCVYVPSLLQHITTHISGDSNCNLRLTSISRGRERNRSEFHSGAVTRPLSAILQLAMMGCPALRARGELAACACAPVLGRDRGGSSSAGARAWWGACGAGARGPLCGVF